MTRTISRHELDTRLREALRRHAESAASSHAEFDAARRTRFDESLTVERSSRSRLVPALVAAVIVLGLVVSAVVVLGPTGNNSPPSAAHRAYRMVPSDRTVSPGQVITIVVRGPNVETWSGSGASTFDRRRRDGSWQRLYSLKWYVSSRDPFVDNLNTGVNLIPVQATPFKAVIPPVKSGEYRITRSFSVGETGTKTLSARVTVKGCPAPLKPGFNTPGTTPPEGLGTPMCTRVIGPRR